MKGGGKRKMDAIRGNAFVVGVHEIEREPRGDEQVTLMNLNVVNVPLASKQLQLDDGFYEIEAIRRKRMHKGQLQYLIKCLTSGKQRRRKRKHVVHHTLPKKRLHRSTTSYSLRHFPATATDNHPPQPAPLDDIPLSDPPAHPQAVVFADEGLTNNDATSRRRAKQPNENGSANDSNQTADKNEENDYDPKLSELRATTNTGVDADNLAICFQHANTSTGNAHLDGDSKVKVDPVQSDRCRGAKRRKLGPVKRFRHPSEPVDTQKAVGVSIRNDEPGWTGPPGDVGNNSHKMGGALKIVKIIKAVGYSASISGNVREVLVTFIAKRSDGTEIVVDNKYLKHHYPLLLIDFYEQHLRYTERV